MIFLFAKLYEKLVKRYVKKVTYFNYVLGFVTLLFSTLIMFFLRGGASVTIAPTATAFSLRNRWYNAQYLLCLSPSLYSLVPVHPALEDLGCPDLR